MKGVPSEEMHIDILHSSPKAAGAAQGKAPTPHPFASVGEDGSTRSWGRLACAFQKEQADFEATVLWCRH